MERWERPVIRHHYKENPSFSSTLLDAIYRSIDDPESKRQEESMICRENMRKKHGNSFKGGENNIKEKELQRACIIEKWMEKKNSYENVDIRRKSVADLDKKPQRKEFDSVLLNSSSTSSESSCGGGFSSSESDSIYGTSRSSSSYTMRRPKPIKTSISQPSETERCNQYQNRNVYATTTQKPKGNSFVKTKSKALKIYGDLKKVKQPISPGGRLASFLNSIFTTANQKKAKLSASSAGFDDRKLMNKPATEPVSTCSSVSSLSRSCLSKTPSSSGKLSAKRSVRFDLLSVIVDEDSRPCGHKNLYEENIMAISTKRTNSTNEELKYRVMNENRRVEEVARDLLNNYQKKELNMNTRDVILCSDSDEEEEEDDTASCSSSDLFELDNLSVIGIERYREELPVYETTHLSTNRAIADGLIL